MLPPLIDFLDSAGRRSSRLLMWVGVIAILAMMMLTVADVCGRYFLNRPLGGTFELTEFLLVFTVAGGLAYTQFTKRHVFVEFMSSWLRGSARRTVKGLGYLVCLAIFSLITWQAVRGGQNQWRNVVSSGAFSIPLWPFYFLLAFGCLILCLIFLTDLLKLLRGRDRDKPS